MRSNAYRASFRSRKGVGWIAYVVGGGDGVTEKVVEFRCEFQSTILHSFVRG
jgi:hypothetical protein